MQTTRTSLGLLGVGILGLALSACGSSGAVPADGSANTGGTGGKDLSHFIGLWAPVSGTVTETCNGQASTNAVSGNVTWAAGTSSDLVQSDPSTNCVIHANLTGSTAAEMGTQTCTINTTDSQTGNSLTEVVTLSAYTFVVSPDGLTATENASGTVVLTESGQSANCSLNETAASFMKQ
jgi:hypothetical protein